MEEIKLDVQIRKQIGSRKIKRLRREHFIPAIVYGGREDSSPVQVDRKTFERIARLHRGENIIYHLNLLDGEKKLKDYSAITKEVQHDPVTDSVVHIDFNRISLTEKIEVKVAIEAKGEPIGVKQDGGSLEHVLWELTVVCLPTQIPQAIEVDVSKLKIQESIHVKDLILPAGVVIKNDPEAIVLTVAPPMKELKAEDLQAAAPTEVEVIKEKKKEPEAAKKPEEQGKEGKENKEGKG